MWIGVTQSKRLSMSSSMGISYQAKDILQHTPKPGIHYIHTCSVHFSSVFSSNHFMYNVGSDERLLII